MWSDVCRLCLTKDNLIWIFDKRFENSENMKDVIYITTGVEINVEDEISQKICKKCCEVTIKMFQFRRDSLANDKYLKEQIIQFLNETVKLDDSGNEDQDEIENEICQMDKTQEYEKSVTIKVHPSVRNLFKVYPQMKLPTVCLKSNISPFVSLPMDQVENYFTARKLDINLHTKLALRSAKIATKKTSTPPSKTSSYSVSNKVAQVVSSENTSRRIIPPIRIVQNKVHDERNVNANKIDENVDNSKRCRNSPQAKKRKLSEDGPSQKEPSKKPAFVESLGLRPNFTEPFLLSSEPPAYVNASAPLHICETCNSVQYSVKDLKKHQFKHLRCQFCKKRFRTLEQKNQHIDHSCIIKNTMNNLPHLELNKIEYNQEVRRKYPDAFVDFPPLENLGDLDDVDKSASVDESVENPEQTNQLNLPINNNCEESSTIECSDIIEILSDDEEALPPKIDCYAENFSSGVHDTDVELIPTETKNPTKPNSVKTVKKDAIYTTVSLVKPDIRIRGSHLSDKLDPRLSDTRVIKELLNSKLSLAPVEKYVQTDLPTNQPNSIKPIDHQTAELQNLKQQLYVYKIPVQVKHGQFKVSYKEKSEAKRQKKLNLWNDLVPIDIVTNNIRVNNIRVEKANQISNKENTKQNSSGAAKQTVSESSSLPSTATTSVCNPPAASKLPQQTLSHSAKFIRINKSSLVNSKNIIDMNPMLNKFLQVPAASSSVSKVVPVAPSSAPVLSSATKASAPVANNNVPVGSIRVKNVWELT